MNPNQLLAFFKLKTTGNAVADKAGLQKPCVVFEFNIDVNDPYAWRFEINYATSKKDVHYYVHNRLSQSSTTEYVECAPTVPIKVFDESLREPRIQWTDTSSPIANQVMLRAVLTQDGVSVYDILFNRLNSPNYTRDEKTALIEAAQKAFKSQRTPLEQPPTKSLVVGGIFERTCPLLLIPLDAGTPFATQYDKDTWNDWFKDLVGQATSTNRTGLSAKFDRLYQNQLVQSIAAQLIVDAVFAVLERTKSNAAQKALRENGLFLTTLCKLCFPYGNQKNYSDAFFAKYRTAIDTVFGAARDAIADSNADIGKCVTQRTMLLPEDLNEKVAHLAYFIAGSPIDSDIDSLIVGSQSTEAMHVFVDTLRTRLNDATIDTTWEAILRATAHWKNLVIYDPMAKQTYRPPSASIEPPRHLYLFHSRTKLGLTTDQIDFYLPRLLFEKAVQLSV